MDKDCEQFQDRKLTDTDFKVSLRGCPLSTRLLYMNLGYSKTSNASMFALQVPLHVTDNLNETRTENILHIHFSVIKEHSDSHTLAAERYIES